MSADRHVVDGNLPIAGDVHADLAQRELGAQRVHVQALGTGEERTVGVDIGKGLHDLGIVGKVVLALAEVIVEHVGQAGHLIHRAVHGAVGVLQVHGKAVDALTLQFLGDDPGILAQLLHRGRRSVRVKARLAEDIAVVDQAVVVAVGGQAVGLALIGVDVLDTQRITVALAVLIGQILIDGNGHALFDVGHDLALRAEDIGGLVALERQFQVIVVVVGHGLVFDHDVLVVRLVELLDLLLHKVKVVALGRPEHDLGLFAGVRAVVGRLGRGGGGICRDRRLGGCCAAAACQQTYAQPFPWQSSAGGTEKVHGNSVEHLCILCTVCEH